LNARQVAHQVLINIKSQGTYGNNALQKAFSKEVLSIQDKALITEIVYGTLTHYSLLIFLLQPYFQGRVKIWVRMLLVMSLYQLLYLEKIPNYAIIDAATQIAKDRGGEFNAKAVNAILRRVTKAISDGNLRPVDEIADETQRLATKYSHPEWLIRLWMAQYGTDSTMQMLPKNNERARMVLRVNGTKLDRDKLQKKLSDEGITCILGSLSDAALIVIEGNPLATEAFKEGLFYIQDEASMLPALALAPSEKAHVLDVCAAPGGKTFQIAEMVGDLGLVYAYDIYQHKVTRIKENAKRLNIQNVEATVCSALELETLHQSESFDYVLVDAPCSGLGILRRHPEAKHTKKPEDLDAIIQIQEEILASSAKLVAPGGRLVYSTCTVNKKENQRQIEAFLQKNPDFELDPDFESRMPAQLKNNFENGMLQLLPQDFETDGFFIASLVKHLRW